MNETKTTIEAPTAPPVPAMLPRAGGPASAKLSRRLRGDLDLIVLKALRKEPQRRYASVEQMAEDIRRHLQALPITAAPDSISYRMGKFVQRHRAAVAAASLILLAVLTGALATLWEARIAAANERRAEQRFNDVRKLANSLMFEIEDAIHDLPGSTAARRLLVSRAQEYLDSLNQQSKGDPSLQRELAAAYERVGDVLGYPYAANLGDKDGALANYRKALALREPLAKAAPTDLAQQRDLVGTYFRLANLADSVGNFTEALAALAKAQPIAEKLAANNHDPELQDLSAGVPYFTAGIQLQTGDPGSALQNYQRAAVIRNAALAANPSSFLLRTHLAADYSGIAICFDLTHDLAHAIEVQSKAVAILDDVSKSNPNNATLTEYLAEGFNRLAGFKKDQGDATSALQNYRKSHAIFAQLMSADRKNSLAKTNFGFSDNGIAASLLLLGKPAEAERLYRESIATFEELAPKTTKNRYVRSGLAEAYLGLGDVYAAMATADRTSAGKARQVWQQAHTACQQSLSIWQDKQKRGELESGEAEESSKITQCVAQATEHLSPER